MPGLKRSLLIPAAVALLPAWLVGGAALGAAVGLWFAERRARRVLAGVPSTCAPANVVAFRRQNSDRLFQ